VVKNAYYLDQSKTCLSCGKLFYRHAKYGPLYWSKAKCCSQKCGISYLYVDNRPTLEEKFNQYVLKGNGCWEWQWLKDKNGYGLLPYAGKQYRAHVVSLELHGNPVTKENPIACHTCDNPSCVNPSHLYPGTYKTNSQDMIDRGRSQKGSTNVQSKLSEKDIIDIRASAERVCNLAKKYNVSHASISGIKSRKTWGHIP
jgi:hypothetical protein